MKVASFQDLNRAVASAGGRNGTCQVKVTRTAEDGETP
jgi:hypothetical protein